MSLEQLDLLTPAELIILQEHLKLGISHLERHLNDYELNRLLDLEAKNEKQFKKMKSDQAEISANLSLVLNTILTATLGAWMGFSVFWGLNQSHFIFAAILSFAFGVGGFIGFQNIQFTKSKAKTAIRNQKLHLLQLEILKRVYQKRFKETKDLYAQINNLLLDINKNSFLGNQSQFEELDLNNCTKEKFLQWFSKLEKKIESQLESIQDQQVHDFYIKQLSEIKEKLNKTLIGFFPQQDDLEVIRSGSQKEKERKIDSFLQKLIHISPRKSITPTSWIRSNRQDIIVGLTPTVFGGFSSLFVYFWGLPQVLRNLGHETFFNIYINPKMKLIEFSVCILITIYFGFSFIYANYKSFKRSQAIEKTEKEIIKEESTLTVIDAKLLKLKELKNVLIQLLNTFNLSTSLLPEESK